MLLFLAVAGTQARFLTPKVGSDVAHQHLGDTIVLATAELYSSNVWSNSPIGSVFDEPLSDSCIMVEPSTNYVNTGKYFSSSTELVDMITESTSLEAGAWGATVKSSSTYSFVTSTKQDVTAFQADWKQPSQEYSINPKCLKSRAKLDPDFENAWRNLTANAQSPC